MCVVFVLIASYALSVAYGGSLAGLLIYAYGPVTQFFPAVVAALDSRRASGVAVFSGLLVGIVVNTVFVIDADLRPVPIHAGAYGLAANVAFLEVARSRTGRGPGESPVT